MRVSQLGMGDAPQYVPLSGVLLAIGSLRREGMLSAEASQELKRRILRDSLRVESWSRARADDADGESVSSRQANPPSVIAGAASHVSLGPAPRPDASSVQSVTVRSGSDTRSRTARSLHSVPSLAQRSAVSHTAVSSAARVSTRAVGHAPADDDNSSDTSALDVGAADTVRLSRGYEDEDHHESVSGIFPRDDSDEDSAPVLRPRPHDKQSVISHGAADLPGPAEDDSDTMRSLPRTSPVGSDLGDDERPVARVRFASRLAWTGRSPVSGRFAETDEWLRRILRARPRRDGALSEEDVDSGLVVLPSLQVAKALSSSADAPAALLRRPIASSRLQRALHTNKATALRVEAHDGEPAPDESEYEQEIPETE